MQSIERLYQIFLANPSISTDTRNIAHESIFFALKGANFNGNTFAAQALKSGAAFVVVDEPQDLEAGKFMLVADVLQTLQDLALHHRKQLNIPIIGLTGSNGKTTTKELIYAVLATKYRVLATKGNLNNHIGVPLTILSINASHEMAIIEMGANAQKEIEMLSNLCLPTHALITNIGKAHLGGFGGYEGVVKAKTELYTHASKHQSVVFIHSADEVLLNHLPKNTEVHFYGEGSEVFSSAIVNNSTLNFTLHIQDTSAEVQSPIYGAYNVINMLCAASIGHYFKLTIQDIAQALSAYVPSNNRSQIMQTGKNTLILDAYNANPSSMDKAIEAFKLDESADKAMILGDMFELGEESKEEHQKIIDKAISLGFTEVFWVGEMFKALNPTVGHAFASNKECGAYMSSHPIHGKKILIKGSRGIALEQLIAYL